MRIGKSFGPIVLICAIFLASCGGIKEPEFREIEDLRMSRLGLTKSTFKGSLVYLNPNKFGLKLQSAEGDAWIENELLGHFTIDSLIYIAPRSEFRLPVSLEVGTGKMIKNSLIAYLSKEVEVRFEGKARLGKGFIYINYPFNYTGKHNLDSLLRQ